MKINKKNLSIQLLALVGLILSIKLAFIYYVANYQAYALPSFCSINQFVDCDGAAKTTVSQFLGIPLAYWGIFFYLIVLFLTFVDKLKKCKFLRFLEVFQNPMSYITFFGVVAFCVSMYLAGVSVFKIHKLCLLCLITYFIDLLIAIVASSSKFTNIIEAFKNTFFDFISGIKTYTKTFIVLLIIAISFLSYSQITYNFIPHMKGHRSIMKYRNMTYNPYRIKGNEAGPKDADVIIELYSDFVCPMCYVHNIMLHQIVKEFKNVKIVHHNFPFDKECNPYISINMHPNACFMSKAAIAARQQGNYWEMSSLLYENQPTTYEDVLKLAKKLNFDLVRFKQDMDSDATKLEIEKELKEADDKDLNATPSMYVNGHLFVGIKPYYKLRKIMIDYGAKK